MNEGQSRLAGTRTATGGEDAQSQERYRERLREHLENPAYRATPGFPSGSDEAILALSDPPYHTACPNPFLAEFVEQYGKPYDPDEPYHREPFAVDASVGKTDALYRAHGYHTKVPHLAIVPPILHYTEPGDLVLDGFCGSGMTGVAAQWCGSAPMAYRAQIAAQFRAEGREAPTWGARRAILNDLSPAATFIAANYNLPFDVGAFAKAARSILDEVDNKLGWMYETRHTDGKVGRIEYTVWSEVYACPRCSGDVIFLQEALDTETKRVREEFPCPNCGALLSKRTLTRRFEAVIDQVDGSTMEVPRRKPVLIVYDVGGKRFEKVPDEGDLAVLDRIAGLRQPAGVPTSALPYMHMTHERARMDRQGITRIHHFFLPRAAHALGALWSLASEWPEQRIRHMLLYFVEQAIWGMSVLNRYKTIMHGRTESSNVNQYLSGVYYVPSQHSEVSPWYNLENRLSRFQRNAFVVPYAQRDQARVSTGTCANLSVPNNSIDYIFTDPPFGENIYYADLNYLVEAWHGVFTDATPESIIDRARNKGIREYQDLMRACFQEYARVLKPGRWMTVVFHNSRNSVWNAIQEAILSAGFVVADVRTMDKQQGSYRQVTSTAVKQDLVISAYKPTQQMEERFRLEAGTADGAWEFVREHLERVPVAVIKKGVVEIIGERQDFRLFDRMVAFHVQRGVSVPLAATEFYAGLRQRFVERDGMYFLSEQTPEYDRARLAASQVGQLPLFVSDEKTALHWLRQQLDPSHQGQPQTYQEIQPKFLRQLNQAPHEQLPELRTLLEDNFLLDTAGRWYVPDPAKASDLERLRRNALLKEFQTYLGGRGKLKMFRTEAIRAGFADAYAKADFQTIAKLAERLPEDVLQEDTDLLMYYDNALLRT